MARVTVRWSKAAESDLASIWMNAVDSPLIERAANEIDSLISIDPSAKGRPISDLEDESLKAILAHPVAMPAELRWLRFGPLEVFYQSLELDCMAIVCHVRRRRG
jgi:hypothetical protein